MDARICIDCDKCGAGHNVKLYVFRIKPHGDKVRVGWGIVEFGRKRANLGRYSRRLFCTASDIEAPMDDFLEDIICGLWQVAISDNDTILKIMDRCLPNTNCPFYTEHFLYDECKRTE